MKRTIQIVCAAAVLLGSGQVALHAGAVPLDGPLDTPNEVEQLLADPQTVTIRSDATWRTSRGSMAVTADWISSVDYDDSDAAGWENAFKSPADDNIWHTSNLGPQSPSHARFRYVFDLAQPVESAFGRFFFDDDGSAFINGIRVVNDTGGGASVFDRVLDPNLFQIGPNLVAVDGFNRFAPYNNIAVRLDLTLVPEPATLGMLTLGGLAMLRRRKRGMCK